MGTAAPSRSPNTAQLSAMAVVWAGLAGIGAGVFFGDYCRLLHPIGQIYVMLLEVAIYPYLLCSLLHGLGSMQPDKAWKLFRSGWPFYVFAWALALAGIAMLLPGIPTAKPSVLQNNTGAPDSSTLLNLIIPSDLFAALSLNYVPAVVLFAIFYGVALQRVKDRAAILSVLDSVRQASLNFWNAVVRVAPVAVFALFAYTAGTIRLTELESIGLYLTLFALGVVIIGFFVLPLCLQALTPVKISEVYPELRSALAISMVTTLSVAAIPFVTAATIKLIERCGVTDEERAEIVRTNLSIATPLGQLGNFFVYLFIVFAGFLTGHSASAQQSILLPFISLVSCFGSPTSSVDAVQFLSDWLHLPSTIPPLYVELMTLTRYGQVALSVLGFAFISFTVVLAYYGKLRRAPLKLAGPLAAGAVLLLASGIGAQMLFRRVLDQRPNPYLQFTLDPELANAAAVTFDPPPPDPGAHPGESALSRIQRRGELRVGFNDSIIPFCYRNSHGQLVGYDVAYAYQLGSDLNVRVRFIPFQWNQLQSDLTAGKFDIAMSGIYVTDDRLMALTVSRPYFQSPLAFFTPRERASWFVSRSTILSHKGIRLGVFDDPVLQPRLRRTFPEAEIVVLSDYANPPDFQRIDGAFWTLQQAEAMAAAHPDLIAVEPADAGNPFLFAYLMPPGSVDLDRFVNYWLDMKKADGFEDKQQDYWIRRMPRKDDTPRWSLLGMLLSGFTHRSQ